MRLSIHSLISGSFVNGPGKRIVIWTQGCGKGCVGCFNPETWDHEGGNEWDCRDLAQLILRSGCDGLTLTGGDPLEQPSATYALLSNLHEGGNPERPLLPGGIICYTGYTIEEMEEERLIAKKCLQFVDLLIDGRYEKKLHHEHGLTGSSNQSLHWSMVPGRGRALIDPKTVDGTVDQAVEVHEVLGADGEPTGEVNVTGFPRIDREYLRSIGLEVLNPRKKKRDSA